MYGGLEGYRPAELAKLALVYRLHERTLTPNLGVLPGQEQENPLMGLMDAARLSSDSGFSPLRTQPSAPGGNGGKTP